MTTNVAINGFGRIGRLVLRTVLERCKNELSVVAINDMADLKTNAHLFRYDSTYGIYPGKIECSDSAMIVDGQSIAVLTQKEPARLPWKQLGVDIVIEATGVFTDGAQVRAHLDAGATKAIITAPATNEDITLVLGVNDREYNPRKHHIVSNASCTTNCLAPMVKALNDRIGVVNGLMTTIHAYTNDQRLTDVFHEDIRRARSATMSMIPTKTGAAAAVGLVMPELKGKLDGFAVRVPTINVSLVDLTFTPKRATSIDEINKLMRAAAEGPLKGILNYTEALLVSVDYNHDPASSTYDATMTKIIDGNLVKVCAWYDNEWGFSNRMIDTTLAWARAK